jgi:hypothetical protein
MKSKNISFRIIGTSGPLTIRILDGIFGVATESKNHKGVGFFSEDGGLLGVEFDDVEALEDHQTLEFDQDKVEIWVKNKQVRFEHSRIKKTGSHRSSKKSVA